MYLDFKITYSGVDSVHFQPVKKVFDVDEVQLTG